MCCDPKNNQKDHDELHVGQCPECGADVDDEGQCVETDDCRYSPCECTTCNYSPCDDSC